MRTPGSLLDGYRENVRAMWRARALPPSLEGYDPSTRALVAFCVVMALVGYPVVLPLSYLFYQVLGDSLLRIMVAAPVMCAIVLCVALFVALPLADAVAGLSRDYPDSL